MHQPCAHTHAGPAIWSQLQTWGRALAANLSFHYFTAILAVRHAACPGIWQKDTDTMFSTYDTIIYFLHLHYHREPFKYTRRYTVCTWKTKWTYRCSIYKPSKLTQTKDEQPLNGVQGHRSEKGTRYSIFSFMALKEMGSEADNLALLDCAVIY